MSKTVKVKLVRSYFKADERQQKVLIGLGLRKMNQARELKDDPAIRGMIAKVSHLVSVQAD